MGYSRPEFREGMVGDNIRLVAGVSSINIGVCGSGYDQSHLYAIESADGTSLYINVKTGGGGSITSVTFTDPVGGFPYIYEDFSASVIGAPGTSATIGVFASPIYINFGQYTGGVSGYGLRGNNGTMEVKNKILSDWEPINKSIQMTELTDVLYTGAFGTNDFLIYSGTCFKNYPITGDMTINSMGVATITTGGISIGQIEFGAPGISITDFQNITGTTGNIQQQLDDKLYTYSPANINRNILVLNGTTTTGTCASIISYDVSASGDGGNCPQVPMIEPSHTHGVCFKNIYHGFTGSTIGETSSATCASICLHENTREVATYLATSDFLNFTLASTGGLAVGSGGKTQLTIENLSDYGTCINNYEDYIAIGLSYPLSTQPNKRIHIKDLIKIPFYTDTSQPTSGEYFQGALAFFTQQGSPGTSYLGIATGNGTSWYGISGIDII